MMSEHVDEKRKTPEDRIKTNGTQSHRLPRQLKHQSHAKGLPQGENIIWDGLNLSMRE